MEDRNIRMEYGKFIFQNIQALIKHMDQKAGFAIVITSLFSSSGFVLLGKILEQSSDNPTLKYTAALIALWFSIEVIFILVSAILCLIARPNSTGNSCGAPGLLFPLMILEKFGTSDKKYLETLSKANQESITADLAQQNIEVSNIYSAKVKHVNRCMDHLLYAIFPWSALVILYVVSITLSGFSIHIVLNPATIILSLTVLGLITRLIIQRTKKNKSNQSTNGRRGD